MDPETYKRWVRKLNSNPSERCVKASFVFPVYSSEHFLWELVVLVLSGGGQTFSVKASNLSNITQKIISVTIL